LLALGLCCVAPAYAATTQLLAEQVLLRLNELPQGYVFGQDSYCAPLGSEGEEELGKFAERFPTQVCALEYERLYPVRGADPDPPLIKVFALMTPSRQAVAEAGPILPELLGHFTYSQAFDEGEVSAVLPSARLFHTDDARIRRRRGESGSGLVWSSGRMILGVLAAGWSQMEDDRVVALLAHLQQIHLETPAPYLRAEGEDVTVFLDNPTIDVPIYWLGQDFRPKGLRPSSFDGAWGRRELEGAGPAGRAFVVQYNPALWLDTWTPGAWARFARSEVGKRQWSWRCTRSRQVPLLNGHAVIYASYRTGYQVCPKRPPRHFSAHVFLPGAVIAIGEAQCRYCQAGTLTYGSFRGMEAVVRSLRRWRG
jgi:hypothetical protein